MWDRDKRLALPDFPRDPKKFDCVEDYVEYLIELWHLSPVDVSLHDFLGMTWEEYKPLAAKGIVPDRITLMWTMGDY